MRPWTRRGAGDAEEPPLWQRLWQQKVPEIAVVLAALGLLTLIFYLQDWLTKHSVLTTRLRIGFLLFTLFGIGFYANAQLSVVNVMTFFNALITEFRWDYFLKEPLIFILWASVAAALLVLGARRFLRLALPLRRPAGADQPPRPRLESAAGCRALVAARAAFGPSST